MLTEEKFEQLLKKGDSNLSSFLHEVVSGVKIQNTKSTANCHFIRFTKNGQVRFGDFAEFLATKIVDYAIPRSEIQEAIEHQKSTGSTSKLVELNKKAQTLFTSLEKSGEGGEVLLYLIIESILKVPQLLCKMSLKTSSEMHYHGCDGIHAKYNEIDDILAVYWGESKLYQDLSSGLSECFDSLEKFLTEGGGSKSMRNRDLQLMRSYVDLGDENLENAIVNYLDKNHEKFNQLNYKGVCLVGFDFEHYKETNAANIEEYVKSQIEKSIAAWQKAIKGRIDKIQGLNTFELHVFLLPFPSVSDFREAFLKEIGVKRKI